MTVSYDVDEEESESSCSVERSRRGRVAPENVRHEVRQIIRQVIEIAKK